MPAETARGQLGGASQARQKHSALHLKAIFWSAKHGTGDGAGVGGVGAGGLHAQVTFVVSLLEHSTPACPSHSNTPRQPFAVHIVLFSRQPKVWAKTQLWWVES